MKKRNTLFFAFVFSAIAFIGCKSTEEVAENAAPVASENPISAEEVSTSDETTQTSDSVERAFFASIERTPCFGNCPTYTMTIYTDGFVEFHGTRGVEMIGDYTTTITDEQIARFVEQAEAIKFSEMDAKYDGPVTDLPSTTTAIMLDGKRKEVYRRFDYPKRILTLEQCFDDLIQSEKWISPTGETYPIER